MLVSIGLCPALALAAPDARQQMYDRLQQQDRDRQQQQLDDMRLPGRQPAPAQPGTVDTTVPGPCFTIEQISLYTLDQTPIPFAGWFSRLAGSVRGRCLDLAGVQALQARLSNALIEHGYVTSRVLVPEQDINAGRLTLLVVVGRIGGLRADGLPEKLLRLALPTREGDTVNLRDLEQVVESLSRLPNMKASMDLVPGQQQGETTVVGKAEWPRPYRASLVVDGVRYVGVGHGTAQAGLELGNPFGINDRLSTSLNADLDKTFADRAWGMGIDYDVARGYWNLAMSHGRQQYQNQIDGVFQTFDTAGLTQTSRLELTRTLHRSGRARLDATLFGTYIDVENLLEEAVIRVSSYHLHTAGSRVNGKYLWGQTLLTGSLTAEAGWGTGAATHLPGGVSIADERHARYQASAQASRSFSGINSQLSLRLDTQYSRDELFPSERYSVASSAVVRGYRDLSLSGNSATSGSLQLDFFPPLGWPIAVSTLLAYDAGLVPGNRNETGFDRLESVTTGFSLSYRSLQLRYELSWPVEQYSTLSTTSRYTFHASLYAGF